LDIIIIKCQLTENNGNINNFKIDQVHVCIVDFSGYHEHVFKFIPDYTSFNIT